MDLDYSRHYKRWHDDSDEHFARQSAISADQLKPYLPDNLDANILEVGCGMGFAVAGLLALGYTNVKGIDSSEQQILSCKKRNIPATLLSVSEMAGYFADIEGSLDLIYAIDVVEHIPVDQTIEVLAMFKRALKPGGVFICRVPNALGLAASRMRYVDFTHCVSFLEPSLDFVLYNAGFREIRIEAAPDVPAKRIAGLVRQSLRSIVRLAYRSIMALEIDPKEAFEHPITRNIIGIAR